MLTLLIGQSRSKINQSKIVVIQHLFLAGLQGMVLGVHGNPTGLVLSCLSSSPHLPWIIPTSFFFFPFLFSKAVEKCFRWRRAFPSGESQHLAEITESLLPPGLLIKLVFAVHAQLLQL